jgi:hypothetical protein
MPAARSAPAVNALAPRREQQQQQQQQQPAADAAHR